MLRQLSSIIIVWSLVSAGLSFRNTLADHNNIYSQLHNTPDNSRHELNFQDRAHPADGSVMDVPSQYWTMDWVMSPMHTQDAASPYVSMPVAPSLCRVDDSSCNPALWQTTRSCNTAYSSTVLPADIMAEEPYIFKNKRVKWRHISPEFTCMAEKIGLYTLWLNNQHSWSLASTHNVNVLVTAVFILFAIIGMAMLLSAYEERSDRQVQYNQAILTAFVFAYLVSSYMWASSKALDSDGNLHRPIGTASYFYSYVFILAALVIFNGTSFREDEQEEEEDAADRERKMMLKKGDPQDGYGQNGWQQNDGWHQEMSHKNIQSMGMNVGGFIKEQTQIGARLKTPGPIITGQSMIGFEAIKTNLRRPVHSKFIYGQLLTLPLLLLALCIHGRNYGIDSQTQIVFVMGLSAVIVDCFLYRLWWAFNIHKGIAANSGDTSEYYCMQLITLLCSLFQVMIFVYFFVCDIFADNIRWLFVVYVAGMSLVKLAAVQGIHENRTGGPLATATYTFHKAKQTLRTADTYLFLFYVVAMSVVAWVYIIRRNDQFEPTWIPKDGLAQQWGPGWQSFHSFSV